MAERENGGRTHEPSLRETVAELDGLRDFLLVEIKSVRELVNERHERYKERDADRSKAVEAAFSASEKSNQKTETAQKDYNVQHNDLIKKMDDQNKATIPRTECEARFIGIAEKIGNVHELIALAPSKVETEGRLRVLEEKIGLVREDVTAMVNKGVGMNQLWGYIVAAAGSGGVLAWIMSHYTK